MLELLNSSLKFAMRGETLTFTSEGIAEKKFFTRYHSHNITKNPQSSSEYPYSLPFVRLHYWHLSVNFMSAFLGWKEYRVLKERQCQWCFIWLWCHLFFIPACSCPFWRINVFCLLVSPQSCDRKSRCQHILWRKMNCNLIKCFQKNYEHQFL